jgi:hypothetical protein
MWAKLDDALLDHRKLLEAGRAFGRDGRAKALGFYAAGLLYANKHLTDGYLSRAVVEELRFFEKPIKAATVMVQVGLWDELEGGFLIHDYRDYNPTAEDVKAERDWDKRRKQLYSDHELVRAVRTRDENRCRYCGQLVDWRDRRSHVGGQFDHVIPRGPNSLENVVIACRGCNSRKKNRTPEEAGMRLLVAGSKG